MDKASPAPGSGPLGLAIFLVSLAVLFAASLVGYWAVRFDKPEWSAGLPALPVSLWVSTGVMLVSSVTIHLALRGARADQPSALNRWLQLTTLLGFVFLGLQAWAWWSVVTTLAAQDMGAQSALYGFTFYMLTGLHGLHVIAGLIPLSVTTVRAKRGRYGAKEHDGVVMCAMYWHFLDVVWLIVFANLAFF